MVEREFTTPEREVRTFSIAVSKRDGETHGVRDFVVEDLKIERQKIRRHAE